MGFTLTLDVTTKAVVSYTAISPLPLKGGLISVALSLESPPPDVIRHPALRSPDFPRARPFGNSTRDHLLHSSLNILTIKYATTDKFSNN